MYLDRGFSRGMAKGVRRAAEQGRDVQFRTHPEYTSTSLTLERFREYVLYKQWDQIIPSDPDYWVENIHSELVNAASSSDMDIVPFLEMLNELGWTPWSS